MRVTSAALASIPAATAAIKRRVDNFFNHHSWLGGNDDNDDLNYSDNEGTKFVVGGDEGGKFLNHCGGNMWMDSDGDLNVRTGDHSWMDMNDGDIFFG